MTMGNNSAYARLLSTFPDNSKQWLTKTDIGQHFWRLFLAPKGTHLSILGYPGSGKTQKAIWLLNYLKYHETCVWFDTCKEEEIGPLFLRGKPINIISPLECEVKIFNYENIEIVFQNAITPSEIWQLIKPGAINIISIRNFFYSETKRSQYYSKVFKELSRRAYKNLFRKAGIDRLSVFVDEAHNFAPSQSMTKDRERIKAGIDLTSNILEVRAAGIRIITGTQDPMMVLPAARKNLPVQLLCQGAKIKSDQSELLHRLCGYAQYYNVDQGLLVYPNGEYFPRDGPWSFPLFRKPDGIRIEYEGQVDKIEIEEEEGV